jgi:hypothetical protein
MAPSRLSDPLRVFAVLAALALAVGGCGSSAPTGSPAAATAPAQPTSTPRATPEPSPTPVEQASPVAAESTAPSSDPNSFVSTRYPYALTYPPGTMQLGWYSANRAWVSGGRWDMGGPYADRNLIAEGGLHVFGAPTQGLDEFFGVIKAIGESHRCTEPQNRRDASIGEATAIGFTQVCDLGTALARVLIVKDGYGIAMFVNTAPGGEIAGRDKAFELLEGLEWRTD